MCPMSNYFELLAREIMIILFPQHLITLCMRMSKLETSVGINRLITNRIQNSSISLEWIIKIEFLGTSLLKLKERFTV